ncbi:hypothetical protein [Labrys wisconsinensis]|uniref:Uncharacterized protein n=1 Tax=Labrys wisconsinensis TaxID=425677 RepID=A0ABU0IYI2_9HYPH|nr:hypothetical protein [Labrys wisconsinensis]MDQ0467073.1 hypothetical protein [Labrys wisconsinensis]
MFRASIVTMLLLAAPAALAQSAQGDWPCVQRRIATISAGSVWSGPDLAAASADWGQDFEAASLARQLASRRTPLEEVDGLVDGFAQKAGAAKSERLLRVFAGVLELTNTERSRILAGISRYAKGQEALAERVRDESDKLSLAKDSPAAEETPQTKEIEDRLKWDTRIFQERRQSLTYVCETPVLLEKRVFEIARRIQPKL